MLVLFFTSVVVDVGERIEFVHHNIDVVATDTMALAGDALAFVSTSNGVEFTAADFTFAGVKMVGNGVYSCGVANEDDFVCQLLGTQVEMETRTISIDDEF